MEDDKIKSVNFNGKTSKFSLQRKYFVNLSLWNNTLENKKEETLSNVFNYEKNGYTVEQTQAKLQPTLRF